jgi:23S rRNA pseudouridine1911/1915/1917 synthase
LLDEIRYYFGDEADLAHRLDAQTSGLVLVAKHKKSSRILKTMFENRQFHKTYLAQVRGRLENCISIDKSIAKSAGNISLKMACFAKNNALGKQSTTHIQPLFFNKKDNTTLVKAVPITGRQHQIRVHLDAIGHPILGDTLYGIDEQIASDYLSKKLSTEQILTLTGANRLMLHAHNLAFTYLGKKYDIFSTQATAIFGRDF